VVISFLTTGHRSVFASQILAMKKSDLLKIDMGEEISHTKVKMDDAEMNKMKNISERLQMKRKKRKEESKFKRRDNKE
jgi:hypothetical protein